MFSDLDIHWMKNINKHSMDWHRQHVATQELLRSGILSGKVLDVGSGSGHRAKIAQEYSGDNVIGLEASQYAVDYANKKFGNDKLHYVFGDATRLPFQGETFDNAYMLAVIEHVEDTEALLGEVKRVLVRNGRLFMCVTNNDYHHDPSHIHIYNGAILRDTFCDWFILCCYLKSHILFLKAEKE